MQLSTINGKVKFSHSSFVQRNRISKTVDPLTGSLPISEVFQLLFIDIFVYSLERFTERNFLKFTDLLFKLKPMVEIIKIFFIHNKMLVQIIFIEN